MLHGVIWIVAILISGAITFLGVNLAMSSTEPLTAKIVNTGKVAPQDQISIIFSRPTDSSQIEQGFSITPNAKVELSWLKDNKELDVKPVSNFEPGTEYYIDLKFKEGFLGNKDSNIKLSFRTEDYPKVAVFEPGENDKNVSIDSDFKVQFEKSVKNFDISFQIDPFENFQYEENSNKDGFRVYSSSKLQYDTEYKIKIIAAVAGSRNGSQMLKEIFTGVVKTEPKPYVAPVASNSAIIPDDQVVDLSARISSGKYIDINLAKQHLSIFENGIRLGTFRVSTGKRGYETPTGTFKIIAKRGRAWSKKYKLFMPYFMQFTTLGHGIHELPEWPGGYKEGAKHLGIPVSHGCVRLGVGPAEAVYNWADIGTPVVIHY